MGQLIKKTESTEKVLENAKKLHTIRNEIIEAFKNGTVFMSKDSAPSYELKEGEQSDTTDMPKLESEESREQEKQVKKKEKKIEAIPDWVLAGQHNFNRIKKEVDNCVSKNLGPEIDDKKIYIHYNNFM